MQTLAKGQALLDKLREASTHADINNSHATKAACYSVERILEALHHRRQQLDEQWKERKKVLEQCIKRCKIDEEIQKVCELFCYLTINSVCHFVVFLTQKNSVRETNFISQRTAKSYKHTHFYTKINSTTVKPRVVTIFCKQPPLLSGQFSKIPRVFKSNPYILEPLVSDRLS